jgi:hypothetical protein
MKQTMLGLDELVSRTYAHIGQSIPEDRLYKVTTISQFAGKIGTATLGTYLGLGLAGTFLAGFISGMAIDGADGVLNFAGWRGDLNTSIDNAADDGYGFARKYNKAIRLPVFLTGLAFVGKTAYDIVNYILTGEPIKDGIQHAITGLGFLSLASSMYLKDSSPALLKKESPLRRAYNHIRREYFSWEY